MGQGHWQDFLADRGFNLIAWLSVVDIEDTHTLLPRWARSLCLVGSAGRPLWPAFQRFLLEQPDWSQRDDPLDDYTAFCMTAVLEQYGPLQPPETQTSATHRCEVLYPFSKGHVLDFVGLAALAGWGQSGPLGLAVHPTYGPWYGLRAAFVSELDCPPEHLSRPVGSVCEGCEAPCVHACPVRAVARSGWDASLCFGWRRSEEDCKERCHSRLACPVGVEHQYTKEQLAFHMRHVLKWFQKS